MTASINKVLFKYARRFPTDSGLNFSLKAFHVSGLRLSAGELL